MEKTAVLEPQDTLEPDDTTVPIEEHLVIQENQRGISFDELFGPYTQHAKQIVVPDPYFRRFHQARNLMDLLETIAQVKEDEGTVVVHLVTSWDEYDFENQLVFLSRCKRLPGRLAFTSPGNLMNQTQFTRGIL